MGFTQYRKRVYSCIHKWIYLALYVYMYTYMYIYTGCRVERLASGLEMLARMEAQMEKDIE